MVLRSIIGYQLCLPWTNVNVACHVKHSVISGFSHLWTEAGRNHEIRVDKPQSPGPRDRPDVRGVYYRERSGCGRLVQVVA